MAPKFSESGMSYLSDIDHLTGKYSLQQIDIYDKKHNLVGLCLLADKFLPSIKELILQKENVPQSLFFENNGVEFAVDATINKESKEDLTHRVESDEEGQKKQIDCQVTVEERTQLFSFINKG